jgi:hypothetical protein
MSQYSCDLCGSSVVSVQPYAVYGAHLDTVPPVSHHVADVSLFQIISNCSVLSKQSRSRYHESIVHQLYSPVASLRDECFIETAAF